MKGAAIAVGEENRAGLAMGGEAGGFEGLPVGQGDAEDFAEGPADGFRRGPAGELFGDRVHEIDDPEHVRGDHAFRHAAEGGDEAVLAGLELHHRGVAGVGEFHHGAEFALVEGLQQIAIGLGGAGAGKGGLVGVGGQENDGGAVFGLELGSGFHAVHPVFQLDIHQHHIGLATAHGGEGLLSGAAQGRDLEAQLGERDFQIPCHEGFVLHYQDTQRIHRKSRSGGLRRTIGKDCGEREQRENPMTVNRKKSG